MEQTQFVLQAPVILLSELQSNSIYISVKMRMCSTRPNLNDVSVTEAFIDEIVNNSNKYICIPLCADVNKLNHGDYKGLGHMYDPKTSMFHTQQIGSFYAFEKVRDEYGVSLIGEARISKRNEKVVEALKSMFEQDGLNFSFEVLAAETSEKEGILIIDASEHNTLVGMAVVSIPAYPEAKAMAIVAELDEARAMQKALEKTHVELAEVALETVGLWVWEALKNVVAEDVMYTLSIDRICTDCAIFYLPTAGKTFKMEYIVGDSGLVVTDVYEVSYVRKEDNFMSDFKVDKNGHTHDMGHAHTLPDAVIAEGTITEETIAEIIENPMGVETPEPVVEPIVPVVEDVKPEVVKDVPAKEIPVVQPVKKVEDVVEPEVVPFKDTDAKKLKLEVEKLKAELEELIVYKEKHDALMAEEAQRELDAKKENIKAFAEKQGLSLEDEEVVGAIDALNYETLITLSMAVTKEAAKSVNPFTSEIKTTGNKYSLLETE